MPKIDTLTKSSKFKKSDYRPWNFIEQFEKLSTNETLKTQNTLSNREQSVSSSLENQKSNNEQCVSNALVSEDKNSANVINASSEPYANTLAKQELSVSNTIINNLDLLTGKERELIIFIFKKCQISASLETPAITTDELRSYLCVTAEHLRNIIYRLSNKGKGLLAVASLKNGKAGWRKFSISNELFQKLSLNNSIHNALLNREQYVNNTSFKPLAEPIATLPSSSSLNKLTTNTETIDSSASISKNSLPQEWLDVDITPLESIGFNLNKLQQIYQGGKLMPEMVQDSIYAYAFDIEFNQVKHNSPINFIMSQLKVKGIPYEFPPNYESPQDRALRRYLEQKKAQRERSQQLHELLKQEAFEEWLKNLPEEEQEKLVPSHQYAPGTNLRRAALVTHYNKHIWPEKERTVLAAVAK